MTSPYTDVRSSGVTGPSLQFVLFDVDGTLYQQGPVRRAMAVRLLRHAIARPADGIPLIKGLQAFRRAQEELRDTVIEPQPNLGETQLRHAAAQVGMDTELLRHRVQEWIHSAPLRYLRDALRRGIPELLQELTSRGICVGVVSDYPVHAKLDAMNIAQWISVRVSAYDPAVGTFKPHPHGIREALRQMQASAQHAVYVGDRADVDVQAATAAGLHCYVLGKEARSARVSEGVSYAPDVQTLRQMLLAHQHL